MPDETQDPEDDEYDFIEQDEEAMELIANGFEPEAPEDLDSEFDAVHNWHLKCAIHMQM